VPKIEVDKIFEVPDAYLSELLIFAKPIAAAIEKSFPCNRVAMVTVGLEVPHAHVHLVPLNRMLDINFSQEKLKLSPESLAKTAELIRSFII
jgi:histidine triad (HIT) family protein